MNQNDPRASGSEMPERPIAALAHRRKVFSRGVYLFSALLWIGGSYWVAIGLHWFPLPLKEPSWFYGYFAIAMGVAWLALGFLPWMMLLIYRPGRVGGKPNRVSKDARRPEQ